MTQETLNYTSYSFLSMPTSTPCLKPFCSSQVHSVSLDHRYIQSNSLGVDPWNHSHLFDYGGFWKAFRIIHMCSQWADPSRGVDLWKMLTTLNYKKTPSKLSPGASQSCWVSQGMWCNPLKLIVKSSDLNYDGTVGKLSNDVLN